jgi:hypothetical protein
MSCRADRGERAAGRTPDHAASSSRAWRSAALSRAPPSKISREAQIISWQSTVSLTRVRQTLDVLEWQTKHAKRLDACQLILGHPGKEQPAAIVERKLPYRIEALEARWHAVRHQMTENMLPAKLGLQRRDLCRAQLVGLEDDEGGKPAIAHPVSHPLHVRPKAGRSQGSASVWSLGRTMNRDQDTTLSIDIVEPLPCSLARKRPDGRDSRRKVTRPEPGMIMVRENPS